MDIEKDDLTKFIEFLDYYKNFVGLNGWQILLANTYVVLGDDVAECDPDIYEKTVKVSLSEKFSKFEEKRKLNVLFHELVHTRIEVHNKRLEEIHSLEEEDLANDLTRGFETLGGLQFAKVRKTVRKTKNSNNRNKQSRSKKSTKSLLKNVPKGSKL